MLCPCCEICTFRPEQIPLEPLPHLYLGKWTSIITATPFPPPPPEIWKNMFFVFCGGGGEGLSIILFIYLSIIDSFIYLTLSATLQSPYVEELRKMRHFGKWHSQDSKVFKTLKPTHSLCDVTATFSFPTGMTGLAGLAFVLNAYHFIFVEQLFSS